MLGENRLVTITGMGGLGKTRLAAETARRSNRDCLFVSIGLLTNASQLPDALLKSLGISSNSEMQSEELEDYICRQLTERGDILLVLDSAEHLIDAVALLAMRLLMKVPALYLLVTSRQILNIPGEAIYLFHIDGTHSGTNMPQDGSDLTAGIAINVDTNPGEGHGFNLLGYNAVDLASNNYAVNGTTPQKINIQFSSQYVLNTSEVADGTNAYGFSDFSSTLTLTGIELVDANGNLALGWTVTSKRPTAEGS